MKLNHLNLCVPDIGDAIDFFATFFAFRPRDVRGDALAVLEGEDGFVLVLSNLRPSSPPVYPEDFHCGFIVDTPEEVHQAHERLVAGGVPVPRPPRAMRGSLIFYFRAPGDILMEVSCPLREGEG